MTRRRASPDPLLRARAQRGPEEACLVVLYGAELGRRVALAQSAFTIGRSTKADLVIDQEAVSRRHARIEYAAGQHTILDLRSINGVFVNETRVTEKKLEDDDRIRIGHTLLVFMNGQNVEARYQDELHRLMTADPLTHIYNKRYFNEALAREQGRAARASGLSLVLFDIDGFERIQVVDGPVVGDRVLRQLAAAVKVALRPKDVFGRVGDGSFGVILPDTDLEGARAIADEVRVLVEALPIVGAGKGRTCTVSLGVATSRGGTEETSEDLFAIAKQGLANAAASGGNRRD